MSLENLDNNEEEQQLSADAAGAISYALDALSELHGEAIESLAPQPAAPHEARARAPASPQSPETGPEEKTPDGDQLESLQSALDWYKDWLSSM